MSYKIIIALREIVHLQHKHSQPQSSGGPNHHFRDSNQRGNKSNPFLIVTTDFHNTRLLVSLNSENWHIGYGPKRHLYIRYM